MNQARTRKSSEDEKTLPSAALPGSDNRPVTWSSDLLSASRPVRSFIILVLYGALFTLFHHIAALWATEQFFSIWFPGAGLRFAFLWISGPRWSPFAAVFEHIAKGLSSKAIALEMGLSPRTIEDHRAKILAKTESSSLADLISLAE